MGDLTQQRLKEVLHYNWETGVWTWIKKPSKRANRAVMGAIAGTMTAEGYISIQLDGAAYKAHRLAFLYMKGRWPAIDVDHKDMNRANNRWLNLREATRALNIANTKRRSDNQSGFKGVRLQKNRWLARITIEGRRVFLGGFDTAELAHRAYCEAAKKGFSEFARLE